HAAVLYSLIGTCRLNNVEPEKWLRYVIEHIQDWPANRVRDLLHLTLSQLAIYVEGRLNNGLR
uniref:transposase domain-containing protein n=1 Tax=Escherichia coli TaxID=562 RepID=UPI00278C85B4